MRGSMQIIQKEDGSGAILRILNKEGDEQDGISHEIDLSFDQVTQLIETLGRLRYNLSAQRPIPSIADAQFVPIYSTHWALQIDPLTQGSTFAFQHPSYGPLGVVLSLADIGHLMRGLEKHRAVLEQEKDRKPN